MEYCIFDLHSADANHLERWFFEADVEKQARLLRFRREEDRVRGICADHLARTMLAERCGCRPAELSFRIGKNGKPCAVGTGLHFNVSHSGRFVCCAVHDAPVGIDIEALRTIRPALASRVCTEAELAFVCPANGFDSTRFLQLWTAKEAYLKYTGEGIAADLRRVPVAGADGLYRAVHGLPLQAVLTEEYALSVVWNDAEPRRLTL